MPENNFPEKREKQIKEPPKRNEKSWWIKTTLLLLLVVLSIVMLFTLGNYLTGEENPQLTFPQLLKAINYPFLLLLLGVISCYILVESSKYSYMLKIYTGKFLFRTSVKTMFLGKYYDGITPMSTGGQPFQIYYLHKKDIPSGAATAIPIMRYIVQIFILSTLSIVLLAVTPKFLEQSTVNTTVLILSWVSLVVNAMLPVIVILFSIFPRPCKKVIMLVIKLLVRLKLVKHWYKIASKYLRELEGYSDAIKQFWKQLYKFIPVILLSFIEVGLFVTIPFFVVIAIGNVEPTLNLAIQIACLVIITRYTALLIPTPGNTGAAEAASSIVFVTVAGIGSVIGWVILVWRFLTYYVYILSGIGINIFEITRSALRNKRAK